MLQTPSSYQLQHSQIAVGWPRVLFSLVIIGILVLTGIQFLIASYNRVLLGRSEDLTKKIDELSKAIPEEDLARLIKFDQQIKNLKLLLNSHVYLSRVFDEIERLTLPQVRYVAINIDLSRNLLSLRGIAPSMEVVGTQAAAFSQSPSIVSVMMSGASTYAKGGVIFGLNITFKPSITRFPTR